MKAGRYIYLLPMIILLLITGGCWNRIEPESLALVLGIGLDYDRQRGEYEAVAEIANPAALVGGEGGNSGGATGGSVIASGKGKNIFEALRQIEPHVSRDLFWGHSEEVIISEVLAREGIRPLLDLYSRERQTRLSNFILVADDDLKEILQTKLPLESETGVGISRQIQTVQATQTVIPYTDMRMVLIDYNRPGKEVFIPRIRIKSGETGQEGGEQEGGGAPGNGSGQKERSLEVAGGAAFRGERMVGWMEPKATQGWLYAMGHITRATEMIPCPAPTCKHYLAVEVHRVFSRREVALVDGKVKVKVEMSVEARLQEKDCAYPYDEQYEEGLHKSLAESVRKKVRTALNRARELRSDIFGFGSSLHCKYPREWRQLEDKWEDHFTRIEVEIEVKANILRPGLVVDPPGR
ncbi:MAG: Ger(x)C family spore germination protein [Firmicutes bacterium]|nr:Ger(x)C family spore germination protein [Bacillota bacterium]